MTAGLWPRRRPSAESARQRAAAERARMEQKRVGQWLAERRAQAEELHYKLARDEQENHFAQRFAEALAATKETTE